MQLQIKSLEFIDSWKLQIELMNIHGMKLLFHATCEICMESDSSILSQLWKGEESKGCENFCPSLSKVADEKYSGGFLCV